MQKMKKILKFLRINYKNINKISFNSLCNDRVQFIELLEEDKDYIFIRKFGLFSNNGPLNQETINLIAYNQILFKILHYFDNEFIHLFLKAINTKNMLNYFSSLQSCKYEDIQKSFELFSLYNRNYENICSYEIEEIIKKIINIESIYIKDLCGIFKKNYSEIILGNYYLNEKKPLCHYYLCFNLIKIFCEITFEEFNKIDCSIINKITDNIRYLFNNKIEFNLIFIIKHINYVDVIKKLDKNILGINSWLINLSVSTDFENVEIYGKYYEQ